MLKGGHPIEPEELMTYLDGELEVERSQVAAEHLERCTVCREAAEDFRRISRAMSGWEVEEYEATAPGGKMRRRWGWWWKGAVVVAMGLLVVVAVVGVRRAALRKTPDKTALPGTIYNSENLPLVQSGNGAIAPQSLDAYASTPQAETYTERAGDFPLRLIARTTQLELATKDFARTRTEMEVIVNRHHGYIADLSARTDTGTPSQLNAQLQIPAPELSVSLSELKRLGRVVAESQTAEDVTRQSTDLDARLANTRITEQRLRELLQQRTGKLSEVLEVEQQISRVRGEIEQMESQRKGLTHRVDYVSIALKLSEAEAAASSSLGAAAHNGWRNLLGGLSGVAELILAFGPSAILWGGLLFFPVRFVWRRWRHRA
jgi:hypothetical protein